MVTIAGGNHRVTPQLLHISIGIHIKNVVCITSLLTSGRRNDKLKDYVIPVQNNIVLNIHHLHKQTIAPIVEGKHSNYSQIAQKSDKKNYNNSTCQQYHILPCKLINKQQQKLFYTVQSRTTFLQ